MNPAFIFFVADDMSTPNVKEGMQAAGVNSILPKEHGTKFYTLPFVKNSEKDVSKKKGPGPDQVMQPFDLWCCIQE